MVLVDTSVWVAVFSRQRPLDLEALVPSDQIVTCLPVVQEVLQGFRDEVSFRRARSAMLAMSIVEAPLRLEIALEGVDLFRRARSVGLTIRSSVDCLIAACAIRHDLEVFHRDRDFTSLARISSLRERAV